MLKVLSCFSPDYFPYWEIMEDTIAMRNKKKKVALFAVKWTKASSGT